MVEFTLGGAGVVVRALYLFIVSLYSYSRRYYLRRGRNKTADVSHLPPPPIRTRTDVNVRRVLYGAEQERRRTENRPTFPAPPPPCIVCGTRNRAAAVVVVNDGK